MLRSHPFVTPVSLGPRDPAGRDRCHRRAGLVAGRGRRLECIRTARRRSWEQHVQSRRRRRDADHLDRASWPTIIAAAASRAARFRIGTEHEKFGFRQRPTLSPDRPYEPARSSATCWRACARCGAEPILDHGNIIGLKQGGAAVSLEPAGQLELSGAPLETLHETRPSSDAHFDAGAHASPRDARPRLRAARLPPAGDARRDAVDAEGPLRHHAPLHAAGRHARPRHDDAHLHGAGEPRLRVREADMVRKLRVGLLLQPLATALFANSPFTEGRPNGFLSYRAHVWTDTDNRPLRHPARDVRGRFRLRALRRMAGRRRADVFRLSRRRIHRRGRRVVPRLHGRPRCTTWPATTPPWATSPTT